MIGSPARAVVRTARGMLGLLGLAIQTRGRLGGPYWAWRFHTAYGSSPPGFRRRLHDLIEFGAWRRGMARHR